MQLGAEVTVLVRDERPKTYLRLSGISDKLNIVRGSLASYHLLERSLSEHSIDTCFHLAAQSLVPIANRSPLTTFESNIRGSWNLLEAARRNALLERLVIASSDKAYGNQQKLPLREDYELSSSYPYETSKVCADSIAQCYYRTYGVPLAITRCSNLYGGGDLNYSRIIPGTIRSLLENERPVVRSDGKYVRDYLYVEDAVEAYLTLAENLDRKDIRGQAFNFGADSPISVLDLVQKLISLSGKSHLEPVIMNQATNEIIQQYVSSEKARTLLGWARKYPLSDGLRVTYDWYARQTRAK